MRKTMLVLCVAVVAIASAGCTKLKARNQLNNGVQAFKSAKYAEAVESFKQAVDQSNVEIEARLVDFTRARRQNARPGNRKAVGADPQ